MMTTVNFAVQLTSFLTGETISTGVSVSANNGSIAPVKNLEGYFVFVNLTLAELTLEVRSASYVGVRMKVCLPTDDVLKIVLVPKAEHYADSVTFKLAPFEKVRIALRDKTYSLTSNLKMGDTSVNIYAPNAIGLSRMFYCLQHKNGQVGEQVFFVRRMKQGEYSLRCPVAEHYERRSYKVIQVVPMSADSNGILRLPCRQDQIFLI